MRGRPPKRPPSRIDVGRGSGRRCRYGRGDGCKPSLRVPRVRFATVDAECARAAQVGPAAAGGVEADVVADDDDGDVTAGDVCGAVDAEIDLEAAPFGRATGAG